ncbi:uncharacterized protein B0I36DRAFT_365472 [Microdochium trichocladiopsis]|uniref:J domain-containing protein n=1 Tax=Microdochium trichocladiopsis TaxID=1682393 RepID=A0A9P9BJP9_9PEZI|nr:uncharacterized protein B0I36DRAFT_365472 [Microdochium trichocladiopsis]KAH7025809.1 hypothetical protein B0I36DRAFT_365472 [Microdochium trichocladiopsis]
MPPRLAGSFLTSVAQRQAQFTAASLVASPTSAAAFLHSTARRQDAQIDKARNHYEALKLEPGATPADIKKSFYKLSKAHHPDHNRNDPSASKRFMRISEAYSTLSIPAKRAAYDRDHMNLNKSAVSRSGSYSSTGPAGGRPASGLSKRRGTYRGPPPSFYRSGGWGGHTEKRREAHDDSTGGAGSGRGSSSTTKDHWSASGTSPGGMGPGQDPFGHADDVPHFDRVSHEKTGRNQEAMRAARRRSGLPRDFDVTRGTGGLAGSFFLISGCIILVLLAPLTYGSATSKKTKESKT